MDGDGDRGWWPPAHPWGERRDEALSLRSSRYSWRLPVLLALLLVMLGTTAVRGLARLDPVAVVVPVVVGTVALVVIIKLLDHRLERRAFAVSVLDAPAVLALRGRHGLQRFDVAEVPQWLAGVRALRERTDGTRLQVVVALRSGHDLVVALVAGDEDGGTKGRDLVVVRRLEATVPTFHVAPRRNADTRVGATVEDLYRVDPGPEELPETVVAWLVRERPVLRIEAMGNWLVVRPPADGPAEDADALATVADALIDAAEQLAVRLRP